MLLPIPPYAFGMGAEILQGEQRNKPIQAYKENTVKVPVLNQGSCVESAWPLKLTLKVKARKEVKAKS